MSTQGSRSGGATVPPATVLGNDWTLIEPPAAGEVEPTATVSVVVDGSDPLAAAALTTAALPAQSYPDSLIEVIEPGDEREPRGEVVVLLGAGTIPAPGHVAAHARWHQTVADAVSVGPAAPIDGTELDYAAVRAVEGEAGFAALLDPRRLPGDDGAFGLAVDLTAALTDLQDGLFCAATLGTLAVRRETYLAAGGPPDASLPAPLRRLDLVHRLACFGAVLVPEPAAMAWTVDGRAEAELARAIVDAAVSHRALEVAQPEAAGLIPRGPFRPLASARRLRRPAVVVNVDAAAEPAAEVLATIEPVLGGHLGDLELRIQVDDGHPERAAIVAAADRDPRTRVAAPSTEGFCESPFQIVLPAVALPDPRTIADLHRLLVTEDAGALHVTVPGAPPDETMIEAFATAALARAERVAAATADEPEAVLGRLFGERWVSGVEVGVRRHGVDEPHITEHGPLAAASDPDHERTQHLRFRDRADDLGARAAEQADLILAERLRARKERLRAERLEARLRGLTSG